MSDDPPVPRIFQLSYQSAEIRLAWTMQGITPAMTFQVTITNVNTGQATKWPATGNNAVILQQLDAGVPYNATVAQDDQGQLGPPSAAVPIITVSPAMTLVHNTGSGLELKWLPLAGYTRYSAVLHQTGERSRSQSVTDTTCFFEGPLTGDDFTTGVAAQTDDKVSIGPIGKEYAPILDAPGIALVQNTGEGLLVQWKLMSGYSHYQATLAEAGQPPNMQVVIGNAYLFNGALTGSSYTTFAAAQSDDGVLVGPPSRSYQPILVAPTMTEVANTGAGLALTWAPLTGYSRFVAVLQQIGQQTQTQSVVGVSCTFPGRLSGKGFSTDVAAQSDDQVLIGPPGSVYVPILDQPSWSDVDYVTGSLTARWVKVSDPQVTGYVVQLTDPDGHSNAYPAGDVDSLIVPVTLLPATTYSIVVRASNGIVLGPWSAALVPLTQAPTALSLGFDGTHQRATWAPSGQTGVTGYVVALFANGAVIETLTPSAPPQLFASGLTTAVTYTAQVRATGVDVEGPWSAPVTGPYAAAFSYAFDGLGRIGHIAWTGAFTETYTIDSAGNIQTVASTPTTRSR